MKKVANPEKKFLSVPTIQGLRIRVKVATWTRSRFPVSDLTEMINNTAS